MFRERREMIGPYSEQVFDRRYKGYWERIGFWMKSAIKDIIRSVLGEFLATFIFLSVVFAMLINTARAADQTVPGTIIPGIVVAFLSTAVIFSFADISGAHFNPAVSFSLMITAKLHPIKGLSYIVAQLLASIAAAGLMYAIFPNQGEGWQSISQNLPVGPHKGATIIQALLMEVYLTFILVFVIFCTAVDQDSEGPIKRLSDDGQVSESTGMEETRTDLEGAKPPSKDLLFVCGPNKNSFAPLAIGLTLGFLCFLGGSSSGGAFNPARVFGASLISGNFKSHWIYWAGDLLGGSLAAVTHTLLFARKGALFS